MRRVTGPSFTSSTCIRAANCPVATGDRKSTRLNSSHVEISYAVFCLKKKNVGPCPPLPCFKPPSSVKRSFTGVAHPGSVGIRFLGAGSFSHHRGCGGVVLRVLLVFG